MTDVTTYFLEMKDQSELVEKPAPKDISVIEVEIDQFQFNKFLYQYIGGPWQWTDKLDIKDSQWKEYVENPYVKTWVAYYKGTIAGYFELLAEPNGDTEIVYFGLAEPFIGKGYGGFLLTQAIKSAWQVNTTQRIWLHTCTLDHISALNNYKARGFKIYKQESNTVSD